jgi:hypothetical protein
MENITNLKTAAMAKALNSDPAITQNKNELYLCQFQFGKYPYHCYTRLPLQNSQLEKWPGPTASSSLFKPSLLWLWLLGPYPVTAITMSSLSNLNSLPTQAKAHVCEQAFSSQHKLQKSPF